MKERQTLSGITGLVLKELDSIIEKENPDIVLVHGDTTTTFSAALSAFYHQTSIGHVEAGLRTWNKYSPWPEEMNRQMTDDLADLYFAPTDESKSNLLKENHKEDNIFVTGNTAIDALRSTVHKDYHHDILDIIDPDKKMILITMHRRENQGQPMRQVFNAMKNVVKKHSDIELIYPVHLNPVVQQTAKEILGDVDRVLLD
jgi:UDP-N-acetylglucosamine 2-epimerase